MSQRISHWVDGRLLEGTSGRTSPVYNPATGQQTARVDLASTAEVDAAVAAADGGRGVALVLAVARARRCCSPSASCCTPARDELAAIITAEHGKVLTDAVGEIARGLENVEFAARRPAAAQGRASPSRRRPASTSTRSASRSASSPASRRSTSRPWCRCGCAPTRSPAATPSSSSRARRTRRPSLFLAELLAEAGPARRRLQRRPRRQGGRRRAARSTPTSPRSASSAPRRSRSYIYETGTAHGKRVQALGGAKNHMLVLPDADLDMAADAVVSAAYGSAGERCMAISVARRGRRRRRRAGRRRSPTRLPKLTIGDGSEPGTEMGPLITARAPRQGRRLRRRRRRSRAPTVVVDGRTAERPRRGASSSAPTLLDHVTPGMTRLPRRDLRPGAVVSCAPTPTTRGWRSSTPTRTATAPRSSPATAAPPAASSTRSRSAWSASTCRSRCRSAYYSFGGWKASLFGDTHMYGPEGVHFYTRGKVVTTRWPDPATSQRRPRLPRTR